MAYRLNIRKFLNTPSEHAGAFIIARVPKSHPRAFDTPHITISDCSRQVTLDFSMYSARTRRNSLRKIRLLRETLEAFEEALCEYEEEVREEADEELNIAE